MNTLKELETKLEILRSKWKSDWPRSIYDPRWPEFRVDKSYALHLQLEIEKITGKKPMTTVKP
jgi:hypothetical protein